MYSDRRIEEGFKSTISHKAGICVTLFDHSCENWHCGWYHITSSEYLSNSITLSECIPNMPFIHGNTK